MFTSIADKSAALVPKCSKWWRGKWDGWWDLQSYLAKKAITLPSLVLKAKKEDFAKRRRRLMESRLIPNPPKESSQNGKLRNVDTRRFSEFVGNFFALKRSEHVFTKKYQHVAKEENKLYPDASKFRSFFHFRIFVIRCLIHSKCKYGRRENVP